jgi:ribonuclease-3
LIHRSFRFENEGVSTDNQRLEFLGDAVLGFLAADELYRAFADEQEGYLTAVRSQLTSGRALAAVAEKIGLSEYLRVGRGEEKAGGQQRPSNLADAVEAVLGAVYLDGGLKATKRVFARLFPVEATATESDVWHDNPKGRLQEYAQGRWKTSPQYRVTGAMGPAHATVFTAQVTLPDGSSATGEGPNKQQAEKSAAQALLESLAADPARHGAVDSAGPGR